ncbi:hypothetical protein GBA52_026353 [Prunus armeniaca]|nr:hypothetical protein GBA52_026353 [Prunus armeniaca]
MDSLASRLENTLDLEDVNGEVIPVGVLMTDVIPKIGGVKGALCSAWSRTTCPSQPDLAPSFIICIELIIEDPPQESLTLSSHECLHPSIDAPTQTLPISLDPFNFFQPPQPNKSTKRRAQVDPYEAEVVGNGLGLKRLQCVRDDGPNDVPSGNEIDVTQISKSSESSMEGQSHLQGLVSPGYDLEVMGLSLALSLNLQNVIIETNYLELFSYANESGSLEDWRISFPGRSKTIPEFVPQLFLELDSS